METDFIGQQLDLFDNHDVVLETLSQKATFEQDYKLKPAWSDLAFTPVKHTFSHQNGLFNLRKVLWKWLSCQVIKKFAGLLWKILSIILLPHLRKKMLAEYLKNK